MPELVHLLIYLIVLMVFIAIVWWVISHLGLPEPMRIVAIAVLAIVALLMLLYLLPMVPGRLR